MTSNQSFTCITSRIVMSGHLNAVGTLFGGLLVQWVDEASAIFVMKTLKTRHIVTKKISEVIYNHPTKLGDVLAFFFRTKAIGKTSLTVECQVIAEAISAEDKPRVILNCDIVFVTVNDQGQSVPHRYPSSTS